MSRKKVRRGYREEHPSDAGKTLSKLPERVPAVKRVRMKGKQGSGTNDGPAQELPGLLQGR